MQLTILNNFSYCNSFTIIILKKLNIIPIFVKISFFDKYENKNKNKSL